MRISPRKLREWIDRSGVSKDALAEAIDRQGLTGRKARAAIDHWLAGRSRPLPKGEDVGRLAEALGCTATDLRHYVGDYVFARSSPRKARLVTDMIRGKPVDEALRALRFSKRRAAVMVHKVLSSAVANADEAEVDPRTLVVTEARVDEGPIIKRFQPKDRGRAFPINKRTSHIHVAVDEA